MVASGATLVKGRDDDVRIRLRILRIVGVGRGVDEILHARLSQQIADLIAGCRRRDGDGRALATHPLEHRPGSRSRLQGREKFRLEDVRSRLGDVAALAALAVEAGELREQLVAAFADSRSYGPVVDREAMTPKRIQPRLR